METKNEMPIGNRPAPTENLSFGDAIRNLKYGKMVARKGWNGKGMFIFMRPSDTLSADFISKVKSLPIEVKEFLIEQGNDVEFLPYLCMFTADKKVVNGWLASQTDILAEDWMVL